MSLRLLYRHQKHLPSVIIAPPGVARSGWWGCGKIKTDVLPIYELKPIFAA